MPGSRAKGRYASQWEKADIPAGRKADMPASAAKMQTCQPVRQKCRYVSLAKGRYASRRGKNADMPGGAIGQTCQTLKSLAFDTEM